MRAFFRVRRGLSSVSLLVRDCNTTRHSDEELRVYPSPHSFDAKMSILQKAVLRASGFAYTWAVLKALPEAHLAHCLRVFMALRDAREERARQLCRLIPSCAARAERGLGQLSSEVRMGRRARVDTQML